MTTATYKSKDQHWQDEATVYWFDLDGETYGICESGGQSAVVDADGCPMTDGDAITRKVESACVVTDVMRND
jgi:hypothetical protein